MAFIPTPRGVEIKLLAVQNGVPIVNIWNIDVGHAPLNADLVAVTGVFDAWLTAQLANYQQASIVYDSWVATDISVANGIQLITAPATLNGQATGVQSAANAAFVASFRTAQTGRSFRGRTYVAGLSQSVILDAQHVTTAFAANINTVFTTLITNLGAISAKLAVLSKYALGVARVAGILTEIIAVITDTKIDSQRRRTAN